MAHLDSEMLKKLYLMMRDEFGLSYGKMKANWACSRQTHQQIVDEWNARLESLGIIATKYQPWHGIKFPNPNGTATLSNPAGGWIQIPIETATKILVLGIP